MRPRSPQRDRAGPPTASLLKVSTLSFSIRLERASATKSDRRRRPSPRPRSPASSTNQSTLPTRGHSSTSAREPTSRSSQSTSQTDPSAVSRPAALHGAFDRGADRLDPGLVRYSARYTRSWRSMIASTSPGASSRRTTTSDISTTGLPTASGGRRESRCPPRTRRPQLGVLRPRRRRPAAGSPN